MSLSCKSRQIGNVTVLDLTGRITIGDASQALLHEVIRDTLRGGSSNILINLRDVNYMDSMGLGELISWHTTVSKFGGELRVCEPGIGVYNLFVKTRLFFVLDVHDNEAAALRAFRGNTSAAAAGAIAS